jgi:hypothetical protein
LGNGRHRQSRLVGLPNRPDRGTIIKRKTKSKGVTYDIKYRTPTERRSSLPSAEPPGSATATERGTRSGPAGAQRTTSTEKFDIVADRWLAGKKPRIEASTYNDYEIHLRKRLKPAVGDLKLRQITRVRIEGYLADQDEAGEISRKTVNDSLIPLHQIRGGAVREGVLASNPAKNDDRDHPLELPTSGRRCIT